MRITPNIQTNHPSHAAADDHNHLISFVCRRYMFAAWTYLKKLKNEPINSMVHIDLKYGEWDATLVAD